MPIAIGNKQIPRIKFIDSNIREVRRGNILKYGLYTINYYDRNNINTYEPKEYAWGYEPECVEFPLPKDAPDYFNEYKTHFGESTGKYGWYKSSDLSSSNRKDKILTTDHEDFDLYARWRQHRYSFNGVITYDVYKYRQDPSPSEGAPTPSNPKYPWSGSAENSMPNCTWYAFYRVQEMGYPQPTVPGYPQAGQDWIDQVNSSGGWRAISWTSNWWPGDILVWDGHIAVVESDGEVSESVYTEKLLDGAVLPRGGTAEELYNWVLNNWDATAESYFQPGSSGGKLGTRYWSKQSSSIWASGNGIGILRYYG